MSSYLSLAETRRILSSSIYTNLHVTPISSIEIIAISPFSTVGWWWMNACCPLCNRGSIESPAIVNISSAFLGISARSTTETLALLSSYSPSIGAPAAVERPLMIVRCGNSKISSFISLVLLEFCLFSCCLVVV